MEVTLKIFRFNPETDKKPHYETYKLPAEPTDRVLDLLEYVKGNFDGTLSFRRSCAHGICGSDALRINGHNRLACKMLVKEVGSTKITVEPLLGLQVIKDLIVDMEPFFDNYRSVMPYLVNDEPAPKQERLQIYRGSRTLRRYHQVHPVRLLHHLLPILLGQRAVCRSGGDCRCPPLHLRQPRPRRRRAPAHPE